MHRSLQLSTQCSSASGYEDVGGMHIELMYCEHTRSEKIRKKPQVFIYGSNMLHTLGLPHIQKILAPFRPGATYIPLYNFVSLVRPHLKYG